MLVEQEVFVVWMKTKRLVLICGLIFYMEKARLAFSFFLFLRKAFMLNSGWYRPNQLCKMFNGNLVVAKHNYQFIYLSYYLLSRTSRSARRRWPVTAPTTRTRSWRWRWAASAPCCPSTTRRSTRTRRRGAAASASGTTRRCGPSAPGRPWWVPCGLPGRVS